MLEIDELDNKVKAQAEELLLTAFGELIHLCVEYGITTKRAADLLTTAHFQALSNMGVSRIDMVPLTGFSPKTVRRMLDAGKRRDETDMVLRVIGDWQADPDFPLTLPLDGEWPSFADLRDKYGGDLTLAALSNALTRRGLAERNGKCIKLLSASLLPEKGEADLIPVATDAIRDLTATITNNLLGKQPLMQRRIFSYRVEKQNIPSLRNDLKPIVHEFRDKIRLTLRKHETTDAKASDVEIGVGVFEFMHDSEFKMSSNLNPQNQELEDES